MRNSLLIMACLMAQHIQAQPKFTLGQYTYIRSHSPWYTSPVLQYQTNSHWYAEARYNYEELRTFSLYGGYTFSNNRAVAYTITPMIGLIAGRLQGESAGLNAGLEAGGFYCATQSQYCVSRQDHTRDFFFNWSEAGYRVMRWLYTGISMQYTKPYHAGALPQPGVFACPSSGRWSFPVYYFLPPGERPVFVAGILYTCKYAKKGRAQTGKPPALSRNILPAY